MPRVGIVDDHPVFRQGLRQLLESGGLEVVGEAATVSEARELIERAPEVLIVDLHLPDGSGEEVVRAAHLATPPVRALVLTMAADGASVARALAAGAQGYLIKDSGADELLAAVGAVAAGATVMGSTVVSKARELGSPTLYAPPAQLFPELTLRERQVLGLIADGMTNAQIAATLSLTPKTVANYVSEILATLAVRDRRSLAAVVVERERLG